VLRHLGIEPGDKIAVEKLPSGRIEVRAAESAATISHAFHILKRPRRRKPSIEDMNRIVARGWAGQK